MSHRVFTMAARLPSPLINSTESIWGTLFNACTLSAIFRLTLIRFVGERERDREKRLISEMGPAASRIHGVPERGDSLLEYCARIERKRKALYIIVPDLITKSGDSIGPPVDLHSVPRLSFLPSFIRFSSLPRLLIESWTSARAGWRAGALLRVSRVYIYVCVRARTKLGGGDGNP